MGKMILITTDNEVKELEFCGEGSSGVPEGGIRK